VISCKKFFGGKGGRFVDLHEPGSATKEKEQLQAEQKSNQWDLENWFDEELTKLGACCRQAQKEERGIEVPHDGLTHCALQRTTEEIIDKR